MNLLDWENRSKKLVLALLLWRGDSMDMAQIAATLDYIEKSIHAAECDELTIGLPLSLLEVPADLELKFIECGQLAEAKIKLRK